jgi:hypothetical protein
MTPVAANVSAQKSYSVIAEYLNGATNWAHNKCYATLDRKWRFAATGAVEQGTFAFVFLPSLVLFRVATTSRYLRI